MDKLSTNFSFEELTSTEHRGLLLPNREAAAPHREKLAEIACEYLEPIRALMGAKPLIVHSCFRFPDLNKAVGSSIWSQHTVNPMERFTGAIDFHVAGYLGHDGIMQTFDIIRKQFYSGWHQLIYEYGWIHLGLPTGTKDGQAFILEPGTSKKTWIAKGEE